MLAIHMEIVLTEQGAFSFFFVFVYQTCASLFGKYTHGVTKSEKAFAVEILVLARV